MIKVISWLKNQRHFVVVVVVVDDDDDVDVVSDGKAPKLHLIQLPKTFSISKKYEINTQTDQTFLLS